MPSNMVHSIIWKSGKSVILGQATVGGLAVFFGGLAAKNVICYINVYELTRDTVSCWGVLPHL